MRDVLHADPGEALRPGADARARHRAARADQRQLPIASRDADRSDARPAQRHAGPRRAAAAGGGLPDPLDDPLRQGLRVGRRSTSSTPPTGTSHPTCPPATTSRSKKNAGCSTSRSRARRISSRCASRCGTTRRSGARAIGTRYAQLTRFLPDSIIDKFDRVTLEPPVTQRRRERQRGQLRADPTEDREHVELGAVPGRQANVTSHRATSAQRCR